MNHGYQKRTLYMEETRRLNPKGKDHSDKRANGQRATALFKSLSNWHIAAAVLHAVSFAAIAIAYSVNGENGFTPVLFVDLLRYDSDEPPDPENTLSCDVSVSDTSSVSNKELFSWRYNLATVLMFMPLITSGFHVIQAILCRALDAATSPYLLSIKNGINWVRWLEYSITASLMTWILAQLSGITNIYVLFLVAVTGNVSLQWNGYLHELMFPFPLPLPCKVPFHGGRNHTVCQTACSDFFRWTPMMNGFVIFVGQWSVLMCYFFRTIQTGDVPWFVWLSFVGMLVTFLLFPLVQLLATFRVITSWKTYEVAFIILSLVSKFVLDWTLLFGTLAGRD